MNEIEPTKPLLFWHGIYYDGLLSAARIHEPSGEIADKLHAARHALTQHPEKESMPLLLLDRELHQEWMRHRY